MDPMLAFEPAFHISRALTIPKIVCLPISKVGQSIPGWKDPDRSFLTSAASGATMGKFFTLFEFPGSPQSKNPLPSALELLGCWLDKAACNRQP